MTRIVFMGTPEFAVPTLPSSQITLRSPACLPSRTDLPGADSHHRPTVKRFSQERGLPVFQPRTLREEAAQAQLAALRPDVIVVAAYG